MAVFSVSGVESQIVSRFIFLLVRVNSWIVSAQRNTIHETTRNTKRYEITPNDEAIVGIPNLESVPRQIRRKELFGEMTLNYRTGSDLAVSQRTTFN